MVFWASHEFERKDSVLCDSGATSSINWYENDLERIQPFRKDILFSDHSRSTTTEIGMHKDLRTPFLLAPTFNVKRFSPGQWLDEKKDVNSRVILTKGGDILFPLESSRSFFVVKGLSLFWIPPNSHTLLLFLKIKVISNVLKTPLS